MPKLQLLTGSIAPPREGRDKGKPVERRGRKATRLPPTAHRCVGATPVGLPNEPKEGFMLSSPRSLGFVLAAIAGAMLVPGCRPDSQFSSSQIIVEVADRPESRPAAL